MICVQRIGDINRRHILLNKLHTILCSIRLRFLALWPEDENNFWNRRLPDFLSLIGLDGITMRIKPPIRHSDLCEFLCRACTIEVDTWRGGNRDVADLSGVIFRGYW